ncbi:MAG: hypothetical protein B7Y16_04330 [Methylotenera sp. 24-45-7]|jgi:uncharacterized protein YdiU (UPF0061 family)|nr:MAG: hypothetical protein B7Y16_04330 [Methylotenera sp. 24-45-7]OZA09677.1 MAG: hypothetical protein B7X97_01650 [Methylotenera sp. 17-45-7]HQS38227.1 YdiU family protein [Methylotenera sp.]HQS44350.1 YdiU family protein [Methylotenera sp.]
MKTASTSGIDTFGFNFDNSYLQLPSSLYQKTHPTTVKNPAIAIFNQQLAQTLGLDSEALISNGAAFLSGNKIFETACPIAQAYAGHQFGGFNILGDGRAILLGEHITPDKRRVDVQLKGAGRTAYSRSGDGRAALGPMLREYIMSEAMHALGVPTTRSLAVVYSGEMVFRDDAYPGAILTRIADSHIRVGTFQYSAAMNDMQVLKALADYSIQRHFPDIIDTDNPYPALLERVIESQSKLIAQWMHVGFIHGVMNTDNMSLCGETIDYGPCAFMNQYDPKTVFSSIDTQGRYAFGNQAPIAHWNLFRFAESLLPLLNTDEEQAVLIAQDLLAEFPSKFLDHWLAGMRKKLGLFNQESEDMQLAEDLLMYMQKNQTDYTNTFKALGTSALDHMPIFQDTGFQDWLKRWTARLSRQHQDFAQSAQLMQQNNPAVIPRNHLVEEALDAAVDDNNMTLLEKLLSVLASPYTTDTLEEKYTLAPSSALDSQYKTFCGT